MPDPGPERRADDLLGDQRPSARHLRQGDLVLGAGLVHLLLRGGVVGPETLQPVQRRLGQRRLRLLRLELRRLDRSVEGDEHRSALHHLARREPHPIHGAGDLVAQGDGLERQHRPDGRGGPAMLALRGRGDGDGLHRLGLVGRRLRVGGPVGVLPGGEAGAGREDGPEQRDGRDGTVGSFMA